MLLIALYGLLKALQVDDFKRQSQTMTNVAPQLYRSTSAWEKRLKTIVHYPSKAEVKAFKKTVIDPALDEVTKAFKSEGLNATFAVEARRSTLTIAFDDVSDFVYQVKLKSYDRTEYEVADDDDDDTTSFMRAEVYLKEGGQDYDVMGWTKEQIIHDVLDQYEKHLTFLRLVNAPEPT